MHKQHKNKLIVQKVMNCEERVEGLYKGRRVVFDYDPIRCTILGPRFIRGRLKGQIDPIVIETVDRYIETKIGVFKKGGGHKTWNSNLYVKAYNAVYCAFLRNDVSCGGSSLTDDEIIEEILLPSSIDDLYKEMHLYLTS